MSRELWKPLLDEFTLGRVVTGHDHSDARTGEIAGRGGPINLPSGYSQAHDPAIGSF